MPEQTSSQARDYRGYGADQPVYTVNDPVCDMQANVPSDPDPVMESLSISVRKSALDA